VAHVKGQAAECPERGRRRGACDARERTWRRLGIWQHGTVARCAVPRADCPEHGIHAVRMPWEVRPNPRFTALSGAQALAMVLKSR
jgi:transposase